MITILDYIFAKLRFSDFNITDIEPYKMEFKNGDTIDYSKDGRRKLVIHLVTSGQRKYEIEDRIFSAEKGTLIFIPEGTKYKTKAQSLNNKLCSGIGISFNTNITFDPDELIIYYKENIGQMSATLELFNNAYQIYKSSPLEILELKAAVYKLFSFLSSSDIVNSTENVLLKPAIEFINTHYTENLPIKLYAEKCNLSESYFRKKFTEYTGLSPIEYRNQLRFAEAKRMYQTGLSAQQIAERLGFCDTAYFLKLYKHKIGRTIKMDSKII